MFHRHSCFFEASKETGQLYRGKQHNLTVQNSLEQLLTLHNVVGSGMKCLATKNQLKTTTYQLPTAGDEHLKTLGYYVRQSQRLPRPSATCPVIPQHICVVTQQQHNILA